MAWLAAEFSWSRRTADRCIDLFRAKNKVRKLRTLPVSALYTLATASPKLIEKIEQDIKAGERPSVHDIRQQARAERVFIPTTPTTRTTLPPVHLTAPPEKTERPTITAGDVERNLVAHDAARLPERLAEFARDSRHNAAQQISTGLSSIFAVFG
jgi:hypothetical protein